MLYHSVLDPDNPIGLGGHRGVVSDYDHGDVLFAVQPFQQLHNLYARLGIQSSCGFVGKNNLRTCNECSGYSYALSLTARHLIRIVPSPVCESHLFQFLHRHFMTTAAPNALIEERQLHVLYRCLEADEVKALEDEADEVVAVFGGATLTEIFDERAVEDVLATVVVVENAQDVEQRRLAGARRSHDGDELALLYVKADAFEHVQWLSTKVGLVDIVKMYHCLVICVEQVL